MSDSDEIKIYEDGATLSDVQKSEISKGVAWTRKWLIARNDNGSFLDYETLGLEAPDKSEYEHALEQLDNLQVIATQDFYGSLEKGLAEGRLHLNPNIIAQFGGEQEALFALQIVNANRKQSMDPNQVALSVSKYIAEPVVFVNPLTYEKVRQENSSAPSLSSVMAHEATHAAGLEISEALTKDIFQNSLQDGVTYDKYLDSESEIYARIMQLRHDFNIDPKKEFQPEDVQELRNKCKQADEEGNAKTDNHIFDRYSDQQVQDWLNYTSEIKKDTKKIDRNMLRDSLRADADVAWNNFNVFKRGQQFLTDYYENHPKTKEALMAAREKVKDMVTRSKDGLVDFFKSRYTRS